MAQVTDYKGIILNTYSYWSKTLKNDFLKKIGISDVEQIKSIDDVNKLKEIYMNFSEYDFELNYSYNFLFEITNLDETFELIKNNFFEDKFNSNTLEYLSTILEKPILKQNENKLELKFSKIIKDLSGKLIKLPIILNFYLEEKFLHLKIRILPEKFTLEKKEMEEFYLNIITEIKKWCSNLNIRLNNYEIFKNSVDIFKDSFYKKEGLDRINPVAFNCNNNSLGIIRIRKDQNNIMPILTELKIMADKFKDEKDKEILDKYLEDLLNNVDYYKIYIEWLFNSRGKRTKKVDFYFNRKYKNSGMTLIYIESNNRKQEEKDDVIKFISSYKKQNSLSS